MVPLSLDSVCRVRVFCLRGEKKMQIHRRFKTLLIPVILSLGCGLLTAGQEQQATPQSSADVRAKAKHYKGSKTPPKDLTKSADGHWTPYAAPGQAPEGVEVYIIQPQDTLSGVSKAKLGDMYLWPNIWDLNPYIKDAHWIYPGDPLWIKKADIISEATPLEETLKEEEEAAHKKGMVLQIDQEAPAPPIHLHDLICSGFISKSFELPTLRIASAFEKIKESKADGDIVYLNEGSSKGHKPGDLFYVIRLVQKIHHPDTGDYIGMYFLRVGQVKLLAVQENTSIAQVVQSCDEIKYGNLLMPYRDFEIPWELVASSDIPLYLPDSDKTKGRVVWTSDRTDANGIASIAYIDLGANQKLSVGDKLWIYRFAGTQDTLVEEYNDLYRQQKIDVGVKDLYRVKDNIDKSYKPGKEDDPSKPRKDLKAAERLKGDIAKLRKFTGEAIVLTTEANTACVKVILSKEEAKIGDWVEIQ